MFREDAVSLGGLLQCVGPPSLPLVTARGFRIVAGGRSQPLMGTLVVSSPMDKPGLLVRITPVWEHIEPLRQYVNVWVKTKAGMEVADRSGLIVQELLENAVKYGDPKADVELALCVHRAGQAIDIRVSNRAHPSRLAILEREVHRNRANEPREAFARALERLQRLPEGSSMLGLSRVALESTLDVEIGIDSVTMTAHVVAGAQPGPRSASKPGSGKIVRPDAAPPSSHYSSGTLRLDPAVTSGSQTRSAVGGSGNPEQPARADSVASRVPFGRK
jgi:hypothetical protein